MVDWTRQPSRRSRSRFGRPLLRAPALLLALPASIAPALAAPAAAQEADIPDTPDFSGVTTKAAAQRLVREGQLVEIALFPTELGGPEEPMNMSYITPEAAYVRELVIGTLTRFFEDGVIDQLKVVPEYSGDSIVPRSILMSATQSGQEGHFATTIDVW